MLLDLAWAEDSPEGLGSTGTMLSGSGVNSDEHDSKKVSCVPFVFSTEISEAQLSTVMYLPCETIKQLYIQLYKH